MEGDKNSAVTDKSMIEFCSKKRMVIAVILLICLSIITLIVESRWSYQHKLKEAIVQAIANSNETCKSNKYIVVDTCKRCSRQELKEERHFCEETGYKMLIKCDGDKMMYKGCDITPDAEERQFYVFEAVWFVIGVVSYIVVQYRRGLLDRQMMDKINKQIAAGI